MIPRYVRDRDVRFSATDRRGMIAQGFWGNSMGKMLLNGDSLSLRVGKHIL